MKTIGRINRTGVVSFHDASLAVWEEGLSSRMSFEQRDAWERQFKLQVFARVVQMLNRLGWTVAPWDKAHQYAAIANSHRTCHKGDLKGELDISGRTIKFEMWQDLVTPTRKDGLGRYEFNKEAIMPYVLRLEMERTRRRIRDYLVNVFEGYSFKPQDPTMGPSGLTALEYVSHDARTSGHYNAELGRARYTNGPSSCLTKDKVVIDHGCKVWGFDRKGRPYTGTAYYSLNDRWQVVTGRYGIQWASAWELCAIQPPNLRVKRNAEIRRQRLEQELAKATKAMNFERAAVLRDVLFPPGTGPLFNLRQKDGLYWGPNSRGYTRDSAEAGKYTRAEADSIIKGSDRGLVAEEVGHAHA